MGVQSQCVSRIHLGTSDGAADVVGLFRGHFPRMLSRAIRCGTPGARILCIALAWYSSFGLRGVPKVSDLMHLQSGFSLPSQS
jgi:hypothetical protein